ncbi:MAG TPA: endonuclease/exonuclease/phosphatase family protein [Hyphomicrobiaceae bacterium]|nr:endonuclease/exonuclease/phosphatase family protein [Hyphomicrobiaceae bacterium]
MLLYILTGLLALATLLPLVPWPSGIIRVCDFPRIQIAVAALLLLVTAWVLDGVGEHPLLTAVLLTILVAQGWACRMYTPFYPVQSARLEGPSDPENSVRVFSANVKLSNKCFDATVALATQVAPDIAIFMEVDDEWIRALGPLRSELPHAVAWPSDDGYGMLVLSKLPLLEPELRFLVFDNVPSVRTRVRLRNGEHVRLYAVHPEPPVPYEDTVGRDGELVMIAAEVKHDRLPAIVAGDLNDVAWSRTTRRFQRLSGLLDPRVGRGMFSTFDARFPGLRWPLDHLFHDGRFRLVSIERLPYIGSDHFPILFELSLDRQPPPEAATIPQADKQDQREAREVVSEAAELNREPVGGNWEQKA